MSLIFICYCSYFLIASVKANVNVLSAALWKIGANNPLKSAPTLLKDRPKYIHCPRIESKRPPTPICKSDSNVDKN